MPKLSIITINLNDACGLKKTMESVVAQSSKDFEYIIIDGGSTDGSVDVIKSLSGIASGTYISSLPFSHSSPIVYWISESDTGIYNAMNKGIQVAKGEYCQFLNSGDTLIEPEVTEQMLYNLPDCSFIYGNKIKQMPNGKIIHEGQINTSSLLTFYKGTLNHCTTYIKRSLFDKFGLYDENLKIVSDWKFYLIAIGLNNEKTVYRNINVAYFNMDGKSNIDKELNKEERSMVLREILPVNILSDYDNYGLSIFQINRIKRYFLTKYLFWVIDKILFKMEVLLFNKRRRY
jgi:glycosyltransferase involved in cell wall biosynthesis